MKKNQTKTKTVRLRIDEGTYRILKIRSLYFYNGNVSEFLRQAIINFKARKNVSKK